jgi:hypothetical protein
MAPAIVIQADASGFFVRFSAPCAERFAVKAAGFRYNGDGAWYGSEAAAAKLAAQPGVAVTEEAKERLGTALAAAAERAEVEARNREASRAAEADVEIPVPAGLAYLPYQRAGIAYAAGKPGVLIGDEMGLGKTIQAIGIINARPEVRSVLIICPASLKTNWRRECEKWSVRPVRIVVATSSKPSVESLDHLFGQRALDSKVGAQGAKKRKNVRAAGQDPGELTLRAQITAGPCAAVDAAAYLAEPSDEGLVRHHDGDAEGFVDAVAATGDVRASDRAFTVNDACDVGEIGCAFGQAEIDTLRVAGREVNAGSSHAVSNGLRGTAEQPASLDVGHPAEDGAINVLIINYDIAHAWRPLIDQIEWDVLIADEAHALKNPKAARTQAVLGGGDHEPIKATQRVLLTGTPIVNRPIELWPLVQALDPQGLGANFFGFAKRYCAGHRNRFGWDFSGASHLDELQDRLRGSIMVRRLKSDVLKELPAKRRQLVPIEATGALAKVAGRMDAAWERAELEAERLRAMAEMAKAEGEKSYKRAVENLSSHQRAAFAELSKVRHELALAKVPAVIEHAKDLLETADKLVIMVHHQDVAQQVHDDLHAAGYGPVMVHGAVSLDQRQRAVDAFQTLPAARVFVGTIRAAGVGLTLTASSTVLFGELDWVPGNVSQAEDRCHRIGQTNSVLVQHLVVDGSLDARLAQVLVDKQAVIDAAMDDKTSPREMADDASVDVDTLMVVEAPVDEPKPAPNGGRAGTTAPETAPEERAEERTARRADRKVAQRCATSGVSRETLVNEGISMSPSAAVVAQQAVRRLAAHDPDAAMLRNDVGFSKADVFLGHALAQLQSPDAVHYAMMRRLVLRYRNTQLTADEAQILA